MARCVHCSPEAAEVVDVNTRGSALVTCKLPAPTVVQRIRMPAVLAHFAATGLLECPTERSRPLAVEVDKIS